MLNKCEKTPFCKIVNLAKLLLCETSFSMVKKVRGDQTLRNIGHFIGGHILFRTKRTYLLNKSEKTPFRKIVIVAKLLLCEMAFFHIYLANTSKGKLLPSILFVRLFLAAVN